MITTTGAKLAEMFGFTKDVEPKDGDGDGLVFDGTEQERPVEKQPEWDLDFDNPYANVRWKVLDWAESTFGDHDKARAFTRWFGDSKIVAENGTPLVVYHGTNAEFNEFDPDKKIESRSTKEFGIYLTPRKRYASGYGENIIPLYVSMKNPKVVSDKSEISPRDLTREDVQRLQSQGFDGIVSTSRDGVVGEIWQADEIVAFSSSQVKHASRNSGQFDANTGDIFKGIDNRKDGDGDGLVFDGTPEERLVEEDESDDLSAVAKRFRIPEQAVRDIANQSADELKRRDLYFPGSNSTEPTTDFERFPIGSVKIDSFHSDPTNAYVNILTEFDPQDLKTSEAEDGIKQRDKSYPLYVEWAKQGIEPPPISTGETWNGDGTVVSSNRRRVLAAQEAGSRSIKAWHSPINKETGLPLKYGDIRSALNESASPQTTKSLSDWNDTMIGQTESLSEKLASFFGFTKAKTQLSLFGDDDCGANGPGGHGFQPGNVCGGKSKKRKQAAPESPSPEKPHAVDRRTRREQIMDEVYLRMRDLNDEDGDPEEYIADDERAELDALDGHTPSVDSPPEKPSPPEVNRSESLFESPVGTDPNPNAVASAASEQLVESSSDNSDKDYIYARKSDVRNAGEDLAMSRRHIANMWKETIESATDDQRAKLLTKANMMRNEPHLLAESWTPEDGTQKGLVHAAVALSLNKFPGSAYDGKYVASAGEDARRRSQDEYVESWRLIKAKAEEIARTETDPNSAIMKMRSVVADRIQKLRADDSKYNPHANQLVDMYKALVTRTFKKTGVGSQMMNLQSAGPEKLHEAIAGVLENKTVAAALGVKGSSKGAKPKTDLDNLRNFYNADSSERIGGRAVSVGSNPRDVANHLIEKIGFRGVQHGNYVPDDERVFHMKATAEACADLLDVTGLRERDLTFDGKLGIAFGARGAGRGALAHYEPTTVVVNITRKSGSGALAHEWGHFFDHMVGDLYEAESGQTNPIGKDTAHYLSDKTKRGDKYHEVVGNKLVWHDRPANPVIDAMRGVQKAVVDSGFKKRLGEEITKARKEGLSAPKAEYWRSDREVFARSFESWVQHALRVQGRKNDYLTSLASNGGMWPTRKEIEAMAPAFETLMAAHRQHNLKTDKAQYSDSDRASLAKSLFSRSLAEFFGFTKESSCGANGPGGQGFQPGNTCGAEDGDSGDDYNPDKENLIPDDGPSQHSDMLHNIKTDPTKQDRAELLQFAKDVATFKIRKDSLLRRAIKELTTDPTSEDKGRAFKYAGDVLTLKPAADFITGKNRGPNPAGDDLKIITGGVRKVVNATVGNLVRLVGREIEYSRSTGPAIPDRVNNHRVPMLIRSFTKAVETDGQDHLIEQITDEVLRRAGDYTDADVVQEAILDVMEEVLAGEFPWHDTSVGKSGGISGTTGSSGGFLQGRRPTAVESDWLNHEFDPDDYDPPERDR